MLQEFLSLPSRVVHDMLRSSHVLAFLTLWHPRPTQQFSRHEDTSKIRFPAWNRVASGKGLEGVGKGGKEGRKEGGREG